MNLCYLKGGCQSRGVRPDRVSNASLSPPQVRVVQGKQPPHPQVKPVFVSVAIFLCIDNVRHLVSGSAFAANF